MYYSILTQFSGLVFDFHASDTYSSKHCSAFTPVFVIIWYSSGINVSVEFVSCVTITH